jgi:hypothetical protein
LLTDQQIAVICYTGHTASMTSQMLNVLGYDAVPLKWAMPSWAQDEAVQAKAFKFEKDASDFPVVTAGAEEMAAEELAQLPATGAPAFPLWLVGLVAGLSSLVAGVALRHRLAAAA